MSPLYKKDFIFNEEIFYSVYEKLAFEVSINFTCKQDETNCLFVQQ